MGIANFVARFFGRMRRQRWWPRTYCFSLISRMPPGIFFSCATRETSSDEHQETSLKKLLRLPVLNIDSKL